MWLQENSIFFFHFAEEFHRLLILKRTLTLLKKTHQYSPIVSGTMECRGVVAWYMLPFHWALDVHVWSSLKSFSTTPPQRPTVQIHFFFFSDNSAFFFSYVTKKRTRYTYINCTHASPINRVYKLGSFYKCYWGATHGHHHIPLRAALHYTHHYTNTTRATPTLTT